MVKKAIVSPILAPPVGPFSHAIATKGFVFLSGQIGIDSTTGKLIPGGLEAETEQLFENLSAVLSAAGKSFNDVVRVGVYLARMSDFPAMNVIYAKRFTEPYPARTTIAVAGLPLGASVEVDLVVEA